ncbi:hypothetical protein GAO09_15930 [Rhizobiales bacterium RZME27]|uniref:Uncharacterized protein n=1 Tax=Endobacterium cereale TaxID=2663029 RepID=A0A6A8AA05_9HYPH|nr:hypothetical protein [Endobacterium cereale]MEB2847059.1 hypothetical protein [Endobacterium cereale]MQY47524.1 hypothetical protein [Endobacterium cereale]
MAGSRKIDPRRGISPEGSAIRVDASGFSLVTSQEPIFRVEWSSVSQIVGYTRFRSMKPELCLAFAGSRPNDQVVVHDTLQGWDALCSAMLQVFAQADRDWHLRAAHDVENLDSYLPVAAVVPNFTVNPTIVWSR